MSFKGKESIQNSYANQVRKLIVDIIRDKLLKKEPITKNGINVSGINTTHGNKTLQKIKKKIKNIIYWHRIFQSWLLMHLIIVPFETWLINWQSHKNIYIWIKNVFKPEQYFSFPVTERNFPFSKANTFFQLCYCHARSYTEDLRCFADRAIN